MNFQIRHKMPLMVWFTSRSLLQPPPPPREEVRCTFNEAVCTPESVWTLWKID